MNKEIDMIIKYLDRITKFDKYMSYVFGILFLGIAIWTMIVSYKYSYMYNMDHYFMSGIVFLVYLHFERSASEHALFRAIFKALEENDDR